MFEKKEANSRLDTISEMVNNFFSVDPPILNQTKNLLKNIQKVVLGVEIEVEREIEESLKHIIISCDASIKENPGGPSAVGVIIQIPDKKGKKGAVIPISQQSRATTNNQAEYEAIYCGLTNLMGITNNPLCLVEVRSDSKLAIDQLNEDINCNDEELKRRRDLIIELVSTLPIPVKFTWRPRCSTPELIKANFIAQDILGVKPH